MGEQGDGHRLKLFEHILDLLEIKKQTGACLLDVGTGLGYFLVSARRRGWEVEGIEPAGEAVDFAREQNKVAVFQGTLNEYSGPAVFEAVTCINVLDHSAEPWSELKKIGRLLKPGGVLYFRSPNGWLHGHLSRWGQRLGLEGIIDRFLVFHEFSFTPKFIARFLTDLGFERITIQNSPPSTGDPHKLFPAAKMTALLKNLSYHAGRVLQKLSGGVLLLGTSLEVLAFRTKSTTTRKIGGLNFRL
jgi:2-polyprenyl-3-methyl-5-hydroxy-6-metoxy-1,4-benzoquinol methylase